VDVSEHNSVAARQLALKVLAHHAGANAGAAAVAAGGLPEFSFNLIAGASRLSPVNKRDAPAARPDRPDGEHD